MVTTESRARPVFMNRFGPWGLVAGASEGLGAAFATALARRGLNLVLVARRVGPLEALAGQLRARWGIEVQVLVLDLADPDAVERIARATAMLAIGLAIYNAAYAPVGLCSRSPTTPSIASSTSTCADRCALPGPSRRRWSRGAGARWC